MNSSNSQFLFAHPYFFLLLALVPVLILLYLFRRGQSNLNLSLANKANSFNLLDLLGYHLPFILRIILLILIIILLARPQFGQSFNLNKHKGVDIMLTVDTSESMSGLDMTIDGNNVDRLTVVKKVLADFVSKRVNDRLGLLVFGEEAFTQCPLTMDHGAIVDMIGNLKIGMVGGATAIGSALGLAVKRLKDSEAKSKVIVLMTDGINNSGSISPELSAELARDLNIKIYTIGIGQEGEVPFVINTPMGKMMIKQETPIDEESLTHIAETSGGEYFRARTTGDLVRIYSHIDKLYKTEFKSKEYNSYKDLYEGFLWAAFAVFLSELVLANTLFFRVT